VDPIHFYQHHINNTLSGGKAIVGGAFVPPGIGWPKKYDNEYLYSDLRSQSIFHMKLATTDDSDNNNNNNNEYECRGIQCTQQRSKYVDIPIVEEIPSNSVLRLRFGPSHTSSEEEEKDQQQQQQISLYHLMHASGTINRLTYIKNKNNNNNNDDDDNNQKPTAVIETFYSSTGSEGVTVRFDGSKSYDPDDAEGDSSSSSLTFQWTFGDDNNNNSNSSENNNSSGGGGGGGGNRGINININNDFAAAAITSHVYQYSGQFLATLQVLDEKGITSNTATVKINIDTDFDRSSNSDSDSDSSSTGTGIPTITTFPWSKNCNDSYNDNDNDNVRVVVDQCGVLEFCFDNETGTYGYQIGGGGDDDEKEKEEGHCRTLTMGLAPVIRLVAGNTYRLTLRNLSSDSTNIHTHGLHVVGSGNGDDITRIVEGGGVCMDYIWDIRPDHPGGTYWYHPHAHSRSEIQVNGGAIGLLIVEDNVDNNNDIPSWASNELLLQILRLDDGNKMLSNGRSYEIFTLTKGKWYRLRISTVDPLGVAQELRFTAGCDVHRVASDGIWHSVVPFDDEPPVTNYSFQMTGSSRGDFAIRCNSYSLESINILFGGKLTAIINIKSGTTTSNLRNNDDELIGRWVPNRPASIRSMISEQVPEQNILNIEVTRDSINGKIWDPDVPLQSLAFNEVYQFELPNTQNHPFHIHLYHMQVMTPNGCGPHLEGEFYDTISAAGPCTVRFLTADFGQRLVVHCHVMFHSDLGSMAWFDVKGDGMPLYELTTTAPPDHHDCVASRNNIVPTTTTSTTTLYSQTELWDIFVSLFKKSDEQIIVP